MRAIIRILIENATDELTIKVKKEVEKIVKDVQGAEVEVTMLPR